MAINPGDKAPDFSLKRKTADGIADVVLSDRLAEKNVVLLFVPLAFTSVCTEELCGVSSGMADYDGLNAEVLGISVDSPFALEAWTEKEGIKIPLLSDLNKTTAEAYDVLLPDLMGFGSVSARAAFVISQDGIVRYAEQTQSPGDLPDFDKVKATLSGLQ